MNLQDKIKQSIDFENISSIRRGFACLWYLFKKAQGKNKKELFEISKLMRSLVLGPKSIVKQIDALLDLMKKSM